MKLTGKYKTQDWRLNLCGRKDQDLKIKAVTKFWKRNLIREEIVNELSPEVVKKVTNKLVEYCLGEDRYTALKAMRLFYSTIMSLLAIDSNEPEPEHISVGENPDEFRTLSRDYLKSLLKRSQEQFAKAITFDSDGRIIEAENNSSCTQ